MDAGLESSLPSLLFSGFGVDGVSVLMGYLLTSSVVMALRLQLQYWFSSTSFSPGG